MACITSRTSTGGKRCIWWSLINDIRLLYDLDNSTVEAISDGNDTDRGIACFSQLSQEQIASVEAVAIDMSAAYVKATKQAIPLAEHKIVHDRFHVMQLATRAVDKVCRGEHRKLTQDDDNRLAKTKYIWLTSQENFTEKQGWRGPSKSG
jgi:transposase